MKLYIEYDLSNKSGKGKFLSRLVPELEKLDVYMTPNWDSADVALGLTYWRKPFSGIPKVLRMDGIHLEKGKRAKYRNKLSSDAINESYAVIWQSNFCKRMGHKYLNIELPTKEYVIFNGDNPDNYKKKESLGKGILLCAKWCRGDGTLRKHKRLKETLKAVCKYANKRNEVVYVVGKVDRHRYYGNNPTYCGHLDDKNLAMMYRSCRVMVYMPKYDWCPNTVVEALCSGLPVLTNEGHGVSEIVPKMFLCEDINNLVKLDLLLKNDVFFNAALLLLPI